MSKAKFSILAAWSVMALAMTLPSAAASCADWRDGPRGRVVEVTDGDTVVLNTGLKVRLIGTQAPKLPLGREGFETWPLADESKRALEELVLGKNVRLGYGGAEMDRYGRALAHLIVVDENEVWAQEAMVAAGWARVYSFPDNRFCLDALYKAERQARVDRLGIWTHRYYQIRQAEKPKELMELIGRYELVEGRVFAAARSGSRLFLNFGRIWKEDFTIVMERDALELFAEMDFDPQQLEGALLRVRGWVDENGGPRITVTHPEQIELLGRK